MQHKSSKNFRILSIYNRLIKEKNVNTKELALEFNVNERTILRDISDIKSFLVDNSLNIEGEVNYKKNKNSYILEDSSFNKFNSKEIISLLKIILASRAFCKEELDGIIKKLLDNVDLNHRLYINKFINNEIYHYKPLRHNKKLLEIIWDITNKIHENKVISFDYTRMDGKKNKQILKPLSIVFSEYYFYLVAFNGKKEEFIPLIFRLDRIDNLIETGEKYIVPYRNKFEEGDFRNKVQFMFSGSLRKVIFEFYGKSLDAILDRLPTAQIIKKEDNVYTISVEVYGEGIYMWLRSQGDNVKIIQ